MSYSKGNAENYKKWVRTFFDGPDSSGAKSDNKKYAAEPKEGITLKEGQATRRNNNLVTANKIRGVIHSQKKHELLNRNRTPAEMGAMILKQKLRRRAEITDSGYDLLR